MPILRAKMLVVSSKPLQIAQRKWLVCFMCVFWALNNDLGVASAAGRDPHDNGHVRVYARLGHIKRAMHGSD